MMRSIRHRLTAGPALRKLASLTLCCGLLVSQSTLADRPAHSLPASDTVPASAYNPDIARLIRGSVKLSRDPFVTRYLEDLLWYMARYSQLSDRDLALVVVDTPSLNAFAAPGGIIGIHTGLLLYAEQEDELASVIAHELAHLSQRHYESSREQEARSQPLVIAALIASMIAASASSDAASAGVASSLALAEQSRLSFSRQNEQEADNIGMLSLTASGFDPGAMPRMFQRMHQASRYGQTPPEFLLTHPVSQSRIADSESRAAQLKKPVNAPSGSEFLLMRARIQAGLSPNRRHFLDTQLEKLQAANRPHQRYGAAVAALGLNELQLAEELTQGFDPESRQESTIQLLNAEIALAAGRYDQAISICDSVLQLSPRSYPARILRAEGLAATGSAGAAVRVLKGLALERPSDATVFYRLAEAQGLAGDTGGLHESRTEYFLLTGQLDLALRQVEFGLRAPQLSEVDKLRLEQLRQEVKQAQAAMKTLL